MGWCFLGWSMRNRNDIAEDMLSWAAAPERAATIVGDLLEAQHGPVAFWVAVLRVTVSIARHQPRRAFSTFFWFAYDISLPVCWVWFLMRMPKLGAFDICHSLNTLPRVLGPWIRDARKNLVFAFLPAVYFVARAGTAFTAVNSFRRCRVPGYCRLLSSCGCCGALDEGIRQRIEIGRSPDRWSMRNEIAEWMLSQVAPPKQAKTILGDLLEEQLGPVKFWCSVLQTAASIAGRDPRRLVVSFTGVAIGLGFYAIFAWIISVGFNPPRPFIAVYG